MKVGMLLSVELRVEERMTIDWNKIRNEVAGIAADLIRINTANPPGNEAEAALYLQEILHREGIEATIYASASKRGNLVSTLKGTSKARPLILLSHLDVVSATPNQWSHPPFSGEISDGYLWGRGALDMKGMLAMELMAFILYKRSGAMSERDLILVATADEKAGGKFGLEWLIEQDIPGIREAEFVISKGEEGTHYNDTPAYACQNGEKATLWVRLSASGKPGRASLPGKENPILKIAGVLSKLARTKRTISLCETTRAYLSILALQKGLRIPQESAARDLSLKLFAGKHARSERSIKTMFYNTVTPTIIKGGELVNILPERCELTLDCRLLPGETPGEFLESLKNHVNAPDIQWEIIQATSGSESPIATGLFDVIEKAICAVKPGALLLPHLSPGNTDLRYFRHRGITAYGFMPVLVSETERDRNHGVDERISLDNLEEGTRILYEVIKGAAEYS